MVDRLVAATIVVAVCFGIGLLIFLPARWLAFRSNPEFKQRTVPNSAVAAWIGAPVFCVYAFAMDPTFGAIVIVGSLLFVAVKSIVEYLSMSHEQKRKLAEVLEAQARQPGHRVLQFAAYLVLAFAGFSILKQVLS
jgi:amino acid transporter